MTKEVSKNGDDAVVREEWMRDYPEFDKKSVVVVNSSQRNEGKVVCCDYDVGITCSIKYKGEVIEACINGALSPNSANYNEETYDKLFKRYVEMITVGEVNTDELSAIFNGLATDMYIAKRCSPFVGSSAQQCAYK